LKSFIGDYLLRQVNEASFNVYNKYYNYLFIKYDLIGKISFKSKSAIIHYVRVLKYELDSLLKL